MRAVALGFALAVLCTSLCGPALAQVSELTWDDPTLDDAVRASDVIVLAAVEAVATNGAAYRVEAAFKGPKTKGERLAVTGLHHPELRDAPPVAKGDRAYLLLRGDPKGDGFTLPTPTFGRFTRRVEGTGDAARDLVVISLGGSDTFARFAVTPKRFEALLAGLIRGSAPKLLAKSRHTLLTAASDPTAVRPESLYLTLEVIRLFGNRDDAQHCLAILREPRFRGEPFVRVRMAAARALGKTGGPRGAKELLKAVSKDPASAVRSVAFRSVATALSGRRDPRIVALACRTLADMAPRQDTDTIRFGDARDPRKNAVDSPFDSCLRTLALLGSRLGITPALAALESEDLNAIVASLAYFSSLGDVDQVGGIAERMRPSDSPDVFVNRLFARTLGQLTGQDLGVDRKAWLGWWQKRLDAEPSVGPKRGGDR